MAMYESVGFCYIVVYCLCFYELLSLSSSLPCMRTDTIHYTIISYVFVQALVSLSASLTRVWAGTIHYTVYILICFLAGIGIAYCIIGTYVDWSYTLYCIYLDMFSCRNWYRLLHHWHVCGLVRNIIL